MTQPKNLAASVKQRLMNVSRERNVDFQLTLIRYATERFLYRLSKSQHAQRFILKGAMLYASWTDESSSLFYRSTRDLDLLGLLLIKPEDLSEMRGASAGHPLLKMELNSRRKPSAWRKSWRKTSISRYGCISRRRWSEPGLRCK